MRELHDEIVAGKPTGSAGIGRYLVVPADALVCAIPLEHALEVLRPLPIDPAPGTPGFVLGMCTIRGEATPVVDLRNFLGLPPAVPTRFIVLRVARRRVALAVDAVTGVERISLAASRPLVSRAAPGAMEAVASFEGALLPVLSAARLSGGAA